MNTPRNLPDIRPSRDRSLSWRLVLTTAAVVMLAYTVTLAVAHDRSLTWAVSGGLANTAPVVVLGLIARHIVTSRLIGRSLLIQVIGHAALGLGFALLSYWMLVVLLGLMNGVSATEFDVRPFDRRALAWQTLQNFTTYGLIAALAHLHARSSRIADAPGEGSQTGPEDRARSRYLIRIGEDILPIDVDRIISITGADDYAEVVTIDGRHLARMTLSEFEHTLDPARFVRVHRSRIINTQRIERAEPAGNGRFLVHMENGETITASRTGARRLRAFVL